MSAQANIPYPAFSSAHPLVIAEYREWTELESIRNEWSSLVAQVEGLSVFMTPEWLFPWWRAYGENKVLCVLSLSDLQAGVVGIIPLYWERRKLLTLLELRVLRLMGNGSGDSDDLDFIVKPGYATAVAHAFLNWLRHTAWDLCEFDYLSSKSEMATLLEDGVRVLGWKSEISRRPQTKAALPNTWEQYLNQLTANQRWKIGHHLRRLQSRHKVLFRRCERPDELPIFLKTLYSLHQKRWEARGEPGSFSLTARRRFYEEMTRGLLRLGWLELWQLEIDGAPVASQIGMDYRDCCFALQEGFDPDYAAESVGYVLRSHVLRQCIETGIRSYDFLGGDEESKQRWGADVGHYVDMHFASSSSLGAAYFARRRALSTVKSWLKGHTSDRMWKMLQKLRHSLDRIKLHAKYRHLHTSQIEH